ncbi:hypothetical protein E2C01_020624 [Portunus trituberculatus]|uniref:Uncharacterized protein n=1 Tax=Portunus trituberculatus TaxID=210409 RepID=A0A5B7E3X9_PORTR|nr:hypothetical protein [Portunus trituberculatus]
MGVREGAGGGREGQSLTPLLSLFLTAYPASNPPYRAEFGKRLVRSKESRGYEGQDSVYPSAISASHGKQIRKYSHWSG